MHSLNDPLLSLEKKQKKTSLFSSLGRSLRFLTAYLALSGLIFGILLSVLNFSAYSSRIMNWVDPNSLLQVRDQVAGLLDTSTMEVHASEETNIEQKEDLDTVTSKILATDPSMIYARSYDVKWITKNIQNSTESATFDLTPYENRLIIPRIGKNVPLIDTNMQPGADFSTMHDVFMEELKKWVVRYPGTAKPGEVGNVFLFGHSSNYPWIKSDYNDVFALLDELQTGDEITIYYFQKKYTYKVTDRATVKPGDVQALEARDPTKKELTLMTCWPVGTALQRILIFAELVDEK